MDVRHFQRFSDLVKAVRKQHNLSQRELAKTLRVSAGYVGQWELRLSQPSAEVTMKLCKAFEIDDSEHVLRLAFAQRAPEWLRESIISYTKRPDEMLPLTPHERRALTLMRKLNAEQVELVVERMQGWIEGLRTSNAKAS